MTLSLQNNSQQHSDEKVAQVVKKHVVLPKQERMLSPNRNGKHAISEYSYTQFWN